MSVRSLPRVVGAAVFALLISAVLVTPASAAPTALDQVSTAQLRTLLSEAGLSLEQAEQRLVEEAESGAVVSTLAAALGKSFAGAWFEPGSTDLVVATTDPAATQQVRAAGAVPRVVSLNLLTLNRVMAVLDSRADNVPDAVTGWYVDPVTNSVVVTATDVAAAEEFVAGQQGVRIEQVARRPISYADLLGGAGIVAAAGGTCSIGFSAVSGSVRYILTSGHCTQLGGLWSAADGTPIGPARQSSFPGNDFGLIEITSPVWSQTANVLTSNGSLTVTGTQQAPVGASVCRSGYTTGYRCGVVEALGQTVNYGGGGVVQGLTRTSACAAPGDSGGPFVSGSQAQGMLSGGSGGCLISLFGTETFFQPVGEALAAYNVQLVLG